VITEVELREYIRRELGTLFHRSAPARWVRTRRPAAA
jgi:hypothetical protein